MMNLSTECAVLPKSNRQIFINSHNLCYFHIDYVSMLTVKHYFSIHVLKSYTSNVIDYDIWQKWKWIEQRTDFWILKKTISPLNNEKYHPKRYQYISSGWVIERTFYDLLKWPNDDNNSQFIKLQVLKQNGFNCYSLQSLQVIIRYKWFKRFPWNHFSLSISWKKIQRQVFVWNWL